MHDGVEITSYSIIREVGRKHGYKHTHILLSFNRKISVRASYFNYINEEGQVAQPDVRAKNHHAAIEAVVAYHYKDGDFPHTNIRIKHDSLGAEKLSELIGLCPTIGEAITRFCKPDLSNVRDVQAAWESLHTAEVTARPSDHLREWQRVVMKSLMRMLDGRQIMFVVDKAGKGGKSRFVDHCLPNGTHLGFKPPNHVMLLAYLLDISNDVAIRNPNVLRSITLVLLEISETSMIL